MVGTGPRIADDCALASRSRDSGAAFQRETLARNVVRTRGEKEKSSRRRQLRRETCQLAIGLGPGFEILFCAHERWRIADHDVEALARRSQTLELLEDVGFGEAADSGDS